MLSGKITDIKNVEETYMFENSTGENLKVESSNKTEIHILKEDRIHTVININSSTDFMVGDNIDIIGLKCLSNKIKEILYIIFLKHL